MITTAKEFLLDVVIDNNNSFDLNDSKITSDVTKAMIEFARLHVQAALDAADAEVPLPYSHGVLNAYPPENIT
jgi:hypothetical protein